MAQPGQQTTLIYGSLTPGSVPQAANLVTKISGVELAINAADGRLFFKDIYGNVRVLADMTLLGAQGNASITGGAINNTVIGNITPSTGNFTQLVTNYLAIPALVGMLKSNGNAGLSVAVPGIDYVSGAMVGNPNGVASLGADGKVPLSQLPDSATGNLVYIGTWDASSNLPALASGVGVKGQFYKVNIAGNTMLDGESTWSVGDQVVFNGTKWERIAESTAPVTSVNGLIGAVVLTKEGLGAAAAGSNYDITSINGLTNPLSVAQGGTGGITFSGLVKANGQAPMSSAVPGVDYAMPTTGNASQLLANNGTGGFNNVTLGTGLQLSGGILSATVTGTSGGTVTSVQVSGGTTGFSFSGGPITAAGTLTLAGTLAVASGGTGKSTMLGILKGNGTSPVGTATPGVDYSVPNNGAAGQILAADGSGGFTNITVGSGLTLTGNVLTAQGGGGTGGSGSVTSIAASGGATGLTFTGSPITSSGTLTLGGRLTVAAGGTGASSLSGILKGNGTSPFSSAVPGVDYALPPGGTANQLLGGNGVGGFQVVTLGTGLTLSAGVLSVGGGTGGTGNVTSVNASGGSTGLTFTGGPITSSGTLTLGGTLSIANGGTGSSSIANGMLKGNGNAIVTATPGVDYVVPPSGNGLLAANGSGGFTAVTVGSGLSFNGNTLTATGGGGGSTPSNKTRIVVMGSSLSAQQPMFSKPWPAMFEDNLKASGWADVEVVNLSINGWSYFLANNEPRFNGKTARDMIISLQPKMLIMGLGGLNDTIMKVDGRTLAQCKQDYATFMDTVKGAVPGVQIVFLGEECYDAVHGVPANLVNQHVMPMFWSFRTTGPYAGSYSFPGSDDPVDAATKAKYADWIDFETYAKSYPGIIASGRLPVWRATRLGFGGVDGLHMKEGGCRFLAASVRKLFHTNPTLKNFLPNLSFQNFGPFDDPDVFFDNSLANIGNSYTTKENPPKELLHPATYFGNSISHASLVWMYPMKPSLVTSNTTMVSGQPFTWLLQGAAPHTQVQARNSLTNSWFDAHNKTDARGNCIDTGNLNFPSAGTYQFWYKVGNEVYGPFDVKVTMPTDTGGGSGGAKAVGTLTGVAGTSYNYSNGWTSANFSTGSALMQNGCYAAGAGSGFGPGIVVPAGGVYRISATVCSLTANGNTTGMFVRTHVNRSGSSLELTDGSTAYASGSAGMAMISHSYCVRQLNAGDKVCAKIFSLNDSTQANPNGTSWHLSVEQI